MPLYSTTCTICHEPIQFDTETGWIHTHSGWTHCGTGDGSVAYPPTTDSRLSTNEPGGSPCQ